MNKLVLNTIKTSVKLNKTYVHTIKNFGFDNIPNISRLMFLNNHNKK
jgi:hypothetical protein